MNNNIDPRQTEVYLNPNLSFIQENPVTDQDTLDNNDQDTEEEDMENTYQRMPQFRLNERRGRFF